MYTIKPGSQYIAAQHVATVGNGSEPASSELRDATYCEPGFMHDDHMMRDILTNKGIIIAQIILITPL